MVGGQAVWYLARVFDQRIGEILIDAGVAEPEDVRLALERHREDGRRLGEQMVVMGFVTERQLTRALSAQLSVPSVDLRRVSPTNDLLDRLPASVARAHDVVPVYVRRTLSEGETLFVALGDPTDAEARAAVLAASALPVRWMVAPRSDIRAAVGLMYFGEIPSVEPGSEPAMRLSESDLKSWVSTLPPSSAAPRPASAAAPRAEDTPATSDARATVREAVDRLDALVAERLARTGDTPAATDAHVARWRAVMDELAGVLMDAGLIDGPPD